MLALFLTVLCLISVSYSSPHDCDKVVQPLKNNDTEHVLGRWSLVAHSMNQSAAAARIQGKDSLTVYFSNSSYTAIFRSGENCTSVVRHTTLEDNVFHVNLKTMNITGTLYHTSCADCVVMTIEFESPALKTSDLFLLSRKREVEESVMEEFRAQAECMHLPAPSLMDPGKDMCPEHEEEAPTEKTDGQSS